MLKELPKVSSTYENYTGSMSPHYVLKRRIQRTMIT